MEGLSQGLQVAGMLQAAVLIGFVCRRVPQPTLAALPVFYFISVIAGFAAPLLPDDAAAGLRGVLWLLRGALPAAAYLLILQLLDGRLPARRHYHVLSLPLLTIPAILVTTAAGNLPVCLVHRTSLCLEPLPVLLLYDALAGAVVLLMLMLVARPRFAALAGQPMGREQRGLVLTIIALQALLIGIDLSVLTSLTSQREAEFIGTALRLTFLYLVASSVFRVFPAAFDLPTPADGPEPALPAGMPDAEMAAEPKADAGLPPPAAARRGLSAEDRALLDRIERVMTRDRLYREPGFGRKQLAAALGLPEHQLSRMVNNGLHRSVTGLINQHRVEEAKQLLCETEEPVTRIAFTVGFNSLASFNRVFKTATATSPTAYRDGCRAITGTAPPSADGHTVAQ